MVQKTLKVFYSRQAKDPSGFTLIEALVVILVVGILITTYSTLITSNAYHGKTRDEKRLSDLSTLERAISEYSLDNYAYPGVSNTTYLSNTLPSGQAGPLVSSSTGWIAQDLSPYIVKLPIDPLNDELHLYIYRHTDVGFELNVNMEAFIDYETSDSGNDLDLYEIGSDLTIL